MQKSIFFPKSRQDVPFVVLDHICADITVVLKERQSIHTEPVVYKEANKEVGNLYR